MIYDTDNRALLSAEFDLESVEVKTFQILIDCEDGHFLRCNPSDITVEAEKAGAGYTNLQAAQIDLSAYSGLAQPVTFNVRLTAPTVTVYEREDVRLAVGRPSAPETPLGLTATAQSATSILAEWFPATDATNTTGYEIRTDGGAATDVGLVYEYLKTGLTTATEYDFEIRAYNLDGDYSGWSDIVSETTD